MTVPKGGSLDDVTWDALYVTEEVICKGDSSATPNPHVASIEGPSLVEENFFVGEQNI